MLRTLLRLAALALLAEGSVTRRLLTSWLGPRTKGEPARGPPGEQLYLLRGGSTKTRKRRRPRRRSLLRRTRTRTRRKKPRSCGIAAGRRRRFPTASVDASIGP